MTKLSRHLACLAGVLGLPAAAGAATVPDGSFENPSTNGGYVYDPVVAGVTFTNHAGITAPGAIGFAAAPDGSQIGFLQNSDSAGSIAFALSDLIVGTSYNVSFYLARRSGYPGDPLNVRLDGALLQNSANGQTLFVAPANNSWAQFTTSSFTATGTTASLSFTGTAELGGDFDVGLDNVTVNAIGGAPTPAAVPEPASWAMMIVGAGLAGAALRRRRAAPALA